MTDTTKDGAGADTPAEEGSSTETDTLFRLQMAASNFLLGNAKYFGWVIGIVLLVALVYGVTNSWITSRQEEEFAAIARIDYKMPKVSEAAKFGVLPMDDKTDTTRMANVEEGARRYAELGDSSHGAAAVTAYLKAADAYERVDKTAERLDALQKASAVHAKDLAGYSADAAYGGALLDAGRTDDALALYRDMAGRHTGFFAERSLILLANAQVAAGKTSDATLVVAEFRQRFPDSPRGAEIAEIERQIGSSK